MTIIWVDRGHQKTKQNKKNNKQTKIKRQKNIEGVREIFRTSNEEEREKGRVWKGGEKRREKKKRQRKKEKIPKKTKKKQKTFKMRNEMETEQLRENQRGRGG